MNLKNIFLEIPEEVVNLKLPDPNLIGIYKNGEDRIYWLDYTINNDARENVELIIKKCNREDEGIPIKDRTPITIMINSPGCNIAILYSIRTIIEISETPVCIICYCTECPTDVDLLDFSADGMRYRTPAFSIMVHFGSIQLIGQYSE